MTIELTHYSLNLPLTTYSLLTLDTLPSSFLGIGMIRSWKTLLAINIHASIGLRFPSNNSIGNTIMKMAGVINSGKQFHLIKDRIIDTIVRFVSPWKQKETCIKELLSTLSE